MKALKIIACSLLALACLLYLVLPAGFGLYASLRRPAKVGEPPAGFESLTLTASDGVRLAAWYTPPKNGAAVVLLHGAGGSREDIRPYARMLAGNGFGVLTPDLRGHGGSGGGGNAFAWEGALDVGAAMAFLRSRREVRALGGLGISVGG